MASGICVFAENYNGNIESVVAELVRAAHFIKETTGEKIQAVQMLPGYTHNIINLSDTEDLVTVMYCNERFNTNRPDTYFDPVNK